MSADASTINHAEAASIARGLGTQYASPSDAAVALVFRAYLDMTAERDALLQAYPEYPEYADPQAKAERDTLRGQVVAAQMLEVAAQERAFALTERVDELTTECAMHRELEAALERQVVAATEGEAAAVAHADELEARLSQANENATCWAALGEIEGLLGIAGKPPVTTAVEAIRALKAENESLMRERDGYVGHCNGLRAQLDAARGEAEAMRAFKAYVHQRLDEAGVEKDPPGPHSDAGCRIGQRLDIVLVKERAEAKAMRVERDAAVRRNAELEAALRAIDNCVCWSDTAQEWHLAGRVKTFPALEFVRAALASPVEPPKPEAVAKWTAQGALEEAESINRALIKCATFDQSSITPEVRERMKADRAKTEAERDSKSDAALPFTTGETP